LPLRITLVVIAVLRELCGCALALVGALGLGLIAFFCASRRHLAAAAFAAVALPALGAGIRLAGSLALALTAALALLAGVGLYVIVMSSNDPHIDLFPLYGLAVGIGGVFLFVAAVAAFGREVESPDVTRPDELNRDTARRK
jgi:hypothetical protein